MSWNDVLIWPQQPALSILVLFLVALPFLFAARDPAHRFLRGLTRLLGVQLRAASRWLLITSRDLRRRNREILLEQGREEAQGSLERQLERVAKLVERDLREVPELQRRLSELVEKLEDDYRKSLEVPPSPPEWSKAVSEVVKLKGTGDAAVDRILKEIQGSITDMHQEAMDGYRRSVRERYQVLDRSRPAWRSVSSTLDLVGRRLTGLEQRTGAIDRQMEKFEKLLKREKAAERGLTFSALGQLVIAAIVLAVAVGGALINFQLIALPMSEMVGGNAYIGDFRMADVAALVIILVEATLGLFLMELLRVTHLFPRLRAIDDRLRFRLLTGACAMLVALAGVEVALAYLRDQIAATNLALRQSLTSAPDEVLATGSWIPTAGQMVLGFTLPFALALIAIPLEVAIHSGRAVLAEALATLLGASAFALRLLADLFRHLGDILVALYDALIGVPILLAGLLSRRRGKSHRDGDREAADRESAAAAADHDDEELSAATRVTAAGSEA